MYSKQEVSKLRHEFWTTFGKYMSPVLSAEGMKINWLNYKTGEKNIYFKMDAENKSAAISILLTHNDAGIRKLYFDQFHELRNMLYQALNEAWIWQEELTDENGLEVSKIYKQIEGVSVYNKADWPTLISFFKPRIIALDDFWSSAKYGFEALR